jgi:hypothetical protein
MCLQKSVSRIAAMIFSSPPLFEHYRAVGSASQVTMGL